MVFSESFKALIFELNDFTMNKTTILSPVQFANIFSKTLLAVLFVSFLALQARAEAPGGIKDEYSAFATDLIGLGNDIRHYSQGSTQADIIALSNAIAQAGGIEDNLSGLVSNSIKDPANGDQLGLLTQIGGISDILGANIRDADAAFRANDRMAVYQEGTNIVINATALFDLAQGLK